MATTDCQKIEKELDELQKKIDNGIKQEKEFREAYAFELEEVESLEDAIPIVIEEEDIDYETLDEDIKTADDDIKELKDDIRDLKAEEDRLIVREGELHNLVFSTQTLINDYQTEFDANDCGQDPNQLFANCILLKDMLEGLKNEKEDYDEEWNDVLDRLNEIPSEIVDLENKVTEKETEKARLEAAKEKQEDAENKEKEVEEKAKNLDENKKNNFPDAANLPEYQEKKDQLLDDLFVHCMDD